MGSEMMNNKDEETTVSEDTRLAVKHGTAWLDENHAGWENKIDLSRLEMNRCDRCIIGQAVGEFYEALCRATGNSAHSDESHQWAIENGFDVESAYNNGEVNLTKAVEIDGARYRQLEAAWADVVNERLNPGWV